MVRRKLDGGKSLVRKSEPEAARKEAPIPIKSRRSALVGVAIVLAGLLAAGVAASVMWRTATPRLGAAAAVGGPFQLVDQDGRAVDQHLLDGKWSAVFFGYTYCPDTCPATLQALGAASRQLGDAAKNFQVVFITVDPERDTPAQMKSYLSSQSFPAHLTGLTGTPQQVAQAAKAYGVYYAKSGSGEDYTMDHSAAVYLMDPHGRFARPLSHDMAPALIVQQIKAAANGAPP